MQRHWNYAAGWRETPRPAIADNDANNSKVHLALDVVGVVTNGAMRDLDMLSPALPIFAGMVRPATPLYASNPRIVTAQSSFRQRRRCECRALAMTSVKRGMMV